MRVLALDISTKTGWALFEGTPGQKPSLVSYGLIKNEKGVLEYGEYPYCYFKATDDMAQKLWDLLDRHAPVDVIVIEETNGGRNRYTQKVLEFIHCRLLSLLFQYEEPTPPIKYISSSIWRQNLGLALSKEEKKRNAKLNKALKQAKERGERVDKAALGIKGKVTKKHIAVRYANETYQLTLKQKDNDIADAICLGTAFFNGATVCNGK